VSFPELVQMMWVVVFFICHQSVYSGKCSTVSWSAKYVDSSWWGFKVINTGKEDSMRCGFHFKHKVLLKACNSRLVMQCGSVIYRWAKNSSAPIMHYTCHEHPSHCTVTCLCKQDQACTCICTSTWQAISNILCKQGKYQKCILLWTLNMPNTATNIF
jgi:hypothetical protein